MPLGVWSARRPAASKKAPARRGRRGAPVIGSYSTMSTSRGWHLSAQAARGYSASSRHPAYMMHRKLSLRRDGKLLKLLRLSASIERLRPRTFAMAIILPSPRCRAAAMCSTVPDSGQIGKAARRGLMHKVVHGEYLAYAAAGAQLSALGRRPYRFNSAAHSRTSPSPRGGKRIDLKASVSRKLRSSVNVVGEGNDADG